jgi:hypothetical protein
MDRETIIKLAREVYGENAKWEGAALERLERLINLATEHELNHWLMRFWQGGDNA